MSSHRAAAPHSRHGQAWKVCLSGMVALSVAMGIGRFAFTPLLPMMLHEGSLSLQMGGWLATANYLGYFLGAMLCALYRSRHGVALLRAGLVATILLTLGMGVLHQDWAWLWMRLLSGVASAYVFVYTAGWCLQQLTQLGRPELGGVIFCGPGLGIALTGLLSGPMIAAGWLAAGGWIAFGVIALALSAVVWPAFSFDAGAQLQVHEQHDHASQAQQDETPQRKREVLIQVMAYGIAGFGYIITATFLPVIARRALPGSAWPDYFWPIFGLSVAVGAFSATRLSVQGDQRLLLTGAYLMQAVGVLLSIFWPNALGFALSCLLLGLPFTAITLFGMREARRLRGEQASSLMALMTAAYGIGQIAGPPLATALVHGSGSFTPSLCVAAVALLIGAALYYRLTFSHRLPPRSA
ncbi:MFS transporter [Herbaspirillum rubrisubalbicans]|uniref:MFS transporter n=1 Tax=Herbaspirillum rubrisubalbicans TaxID=80842 RepID=A0ABX9BWD6_9BURK|nr:YbfB/YjiJ family MFS transporter [Herbaspirillum rubrisubalbicans]RAM62099.1 MFS transporter [Herbaspirillum rubrisubalbicans]RAN45244.1 MFS transporter [Herbaspirillum rubrisubalbicans]